MTTAELPTRALTRAQPTAKPKRRHVAHAKRAEMAAEINKEHAACEKAYGTAKAAYGTAVGHAYRAGELLAQVKKQLVHGEWLPWLEANFEATPRTAQSYIRIANRFPNAKAASHLTVDTALKQLAVPRGSTATTSRAKPTPAKASKQGPSRWAVAQAEPAIIKQSTGQHLRSLGGEPGPESDFETLREILCFDIAEAKMLAAGLTGLDADQARLLTERAVELREAADWLDGVAKAVAS